MSGRDHSNGHRFNFDPNATRQFSYQSSLNLPPSDEGNNSASIPSDSHVQVDPTYTAWNWNADTGRSNTNRPFTDPAGSDNLQSGWLSQEYHPGAQPTPFDQSMYHQLHQGGPPFLSDWRTIQHNPFDDPYTQYAQPQVPNMSAYYASDATLNDNGLTDDTPANEGWTHSTGSHFPFQNPHADFLPTPVPMLASQRVTTTTDRTSETATVPTERSKRTNIACVPCRTRKLKCHPNKGDSTSKMRSCETCVSRKIPDSCYFLPMASGTVQFQWRLE